MLPTPLVEIAPGVDNVTVEAVTGPLTVMGPPGVASALLAGALRLKVPDRPRATEATVTAVPLRSVRKTEALLLVPLTES